MPYKSELQRKYFNASRKKLTAQGVDVDEWNASTKGKKLPEQVKESQDYSLPQDIKPAGSYESLKKTMSQNMERHNAMTASQPAPLVPPSESQGAEKLFQVDTNIPKAVPSIPTEALQTPQVKAASVLASLLYLNKLK